MIGIIIIDLLTILAAWCRLSTGNGTDLDRAGIIISAPMLVLCAIVLVCREVKIQKNLKQMREEEKQKKMQGETKNGH